MTRKDKQFELEKQLHEQYAINNNESVKNFISFIVALLALFSGFGYVFVYSNSEFSSNGIYINEKIMSLEVFLLVSIVVSGMLFFLSLISLQLGYSNRSNQIIIDKIREDVFRSKKENIFGKYYNAKNKNFWTFVPDFFNLFYWLFVSVQILVICLTKCKIYLINNCYIILLQIIFIFLSICFRGRYWLKYNKS